MNDQKPLPALNEDTREFWEGCRHHQLKFQKCSECGLVRWPPSIICPACHSLEQKWVPAEGRGKIFTFAVYHQAFHPAFKNDLPYVVAVIELEEGVHFLSNLVGCDHRLIRCGMPVRVVWEDRKEGFSIPKFTPVQ
ncbi:MAG: hypothetical protein CVU57_24470 [Deltaproteobacteria bacterium HGW-Deltaproteobacteria-15]|nr:MAG: hypothetical protein CVU57_24470 [Deltaproteobacteria bacterium HGW-Deltaproteobacteria-15]